MPTGFWWWGSEAKGKLGRPTRRWEYDIKMDIQEIRWEIVDVLTYRTIRTNGELLKGLVPLNE